MNAVTETRTAETTALINRTISARILARVAAGDDIAVAMDAVLGEGAYKRLAGNLYDALRAKAAV